VTVRLTHWRGPLRRAVFVALVAALTPLPLAAASGQTATPASTSAKPKTMQAAVHAAAVREAAVVAVPRAKSSARADQAGTEKRSPSFFRTGPGVVVLAVMVAGSGYAIYSASHDKINSPAKQ
jgi:hypothetical protein